MDQPGNLSHLKALDDARRTRAELAKFRERYDLAIGGAHLGVWDWDLVTGEHYWSAEFRRLIGVPPSAEPDLDLLISRVHPDDLDDTIHAIENLGDMFDHEHRVVHDDGAVRWLRARGHVVRDSEGVLLRTAGVVADVTQEVEARDFRREVWGILADVTLSMSEKVQAVLEFTCKRLNLHHGGIVRVHGDVCEYLYQVHPEGTPPISTIVPREQTITSKIFSDNDLIAIQDLANSEFADLPAHRITGMKSFIGAPLVVLGQPYGAIWLGGDERRRPFSAFEEGMVMLLAQAVGREVGRDVHIRQLKDSEQRFLMATRAANIGISEWDESNWNNHYWSDDQYRLLGYEPGEIPSTQDMFISLMHPDDHQAMREAALAYRADNSKPMSIDIRLRHKTKGYRWYHATAAAGRDHEGRVRMLGSIMDVHELKTAQERAEAANIAKTQFLATMSHEIRTPLNGVLGMAAALSGTALDDNQRAMLTVINESGGALLQVINQILDLSKIEAGKFSLECAPFVLKDLIQSLGAMHDMKAREKSLRFSVTVADEAAGAYRGDSGRIRQILNNLVANAVKFTDKGEVSLSVAVEHETDGRAALRFDVRDTGPGMTEEEASRLFTPFTQLDSSNARKHEGTGLGLAISRRLAGMMGGVIVAESAPGDGSTFTFRVTLPRAEAPDEQRETENVTPLFGKVRVLSVDDHPTNRMVLEALLKPTGASVVSVASGPEALEAMEANAFDIVLLDIQMPEMDGTEVLKEIRAREKVAARRPVPVVAVTANALKHQIDEYLGLGFNGHLGKPIAVDALTRVVAAAAHGAGADASAGQAQTRRATDAS